MTKWICALFLLSISSAYAAGQERAGLGIAIGEPTGITFQELYTNSHSLDFLLAWRAWDGFFIQGNYDYKIKTIQQTNDGAVWLYAGPGGFLRSRAYSRSIFGFSGNIGVGWSIQEHFAVVFEVSPKVDFYPATNLEATGGIGVRYLF
ncbi:MAG TPA: hypothetical protein VMM58_05725 [Bacteroidota bacterium]|nr:hypothetical protein [Bacteroidota bacterium]